MQLTYAFSQTSYVTLLEFEASFLALVRQLPHSPVCSLVFGIHCYYIRCAHLKTTLITCQDGPYNGFTGLVKVEQFMIMVQY